MVSVWDVIGTALLLGIVHVLTGPDHLSALSTLSVGKKLKVAFGLGVRWGCGHSFGLLIVAIIFFAVGQSVNLDVLTYWADMFVGVFMIVLGGWYTFKAWRERMKNLQELEDQEVKNLLQQPVQNMDMDMIDINRDHSKNDNDQHHHNNDDDEHSDQEQIELEQVNIHKNKNRKDDKNENGKLYDDDNNNNDNDSEPHEQSQNDDNDEDDARDRDPSNESDESTNKEHSEQHQLKEVVVTYQNNKHDDIIPDDDMIIDGNASRNPLFDKDETARTKCLTRIAAFIAGIFHGIAGPGGVLGVMVALRLNDWILSSLYLFLFFLSSIVTMGFYAISYGWATQRLTVCANNKQKCAFILKIISAIFSLIIGVLWLSLTFTGTLDQIFD